MTVRVQYMYCQSDCYFRGYPDRWGHRERVTVRVQYTYCHKLPPGRGVATLSHEL